MARELPSIRRERIIDILQSRDIVSAKELTNIFKVDRKTIYKDIDYLQGHYLIERIKARHGGYRYVGPRLNREYVLSRNQTELFRSFESRVEMSPKEMVEYKLGMKILDNQVAMIKKMEETE